MNWVCPYCRHAQAVTENHRDVQHRHLAVPAGARGAVGVRTVAMLCANVDCRHLSLRVDLVRDKVEVGFPLLGRDAGADPLEVFQLLPESTAQPQPDFIPAPLREDYYEACRIKDLSPKASATLARRCLQGMIRDFCGIAKGTLDQEIKALQALVEEGNEPKGVTPESVDAIDAVRSVGNIGAHMERDINLILAVEPDEAQMLIGLVESLFDEWYVARDRRQRKFQAVRDLAEAKKAQRKEALAKPPSEPLAIVDARPPGIVPAD